MSTHDHNKELSELLTHGEWVRGVARRLVGDPATAEDIVQETWVTVLERPLEGGSRGRGWWARAVLNRARQRGRTEARRRARERTVAGPEAGASVEELAAKAALQREVVGHVLALDEPFRTVVLLRFFEELTPPQIAERLDVPLKTVHSRLQRAFDKLRMKLDGEYGQRGVWCQALAPLLGARGSASVGAAGALGSTFFKAGAWIMQGNIKAGIVALVALTGGVGLWQLVGGESGDSSVFPSEGGAFDAAIAPAPPSTEHGPEAGGVVVAAGREALDVVRDESQADTPEVALVAVHGRVLDLQGAPLGGMAIVLAGAPSETLAMSEADGSFELSLPLGDEQLWSGNSSRSCLEVADPDWITLRQSCPERSTFGSEQLIVAAPVTSLEGWLEDSDGLPVAAARVRLTQLGTAFFNFPEVLEMTRFVDRVADSDAEGHFRLERFPAAQGLRLQIRCEGFQVRSVDLDGESRPLHIRLARAEETDRPFLEGFVLDARGFPVEGAEVRLAEARTNSDRTGRFRVPIGHVAPTTPLCASKAGRLPALVPNFGEVIESQGGTPAPVELMLGGEPLAIAGRVIDENGVPCAGWSVAVVDATAVSQFRHPVDAAEDLARGGVEDVTTDDEGHFRLTGLFARDYSLQAWEPSGLFSVERRVAAGSEGVVLRASRAVWPEVSGRVIDSRGQPLAEVRLTLSLDTSRSLVGYASISGEETFTDKDGVFEFADVPKNAVYLSYRGESILPGNHRFEQGERPTALTIEAVRRCHFRLEVAPSVRSAKLLDAEGNRLQVNRFEAFGMSAFPFVQLENGRSEVLSVSEMATTLVLVDEDGNELPYPIRLDLEGVNVLCF